MKMKQTEKQSKYRRLYATAELIVELCHDRIIHVTDYRTRRG